MNELTGTQIAEMIQATAKALVEKREELNMLDSALGDGDHGAAISVAFSEAANQLNALQNPVPADALKTTALALMNRMGGASGALFGTLFLQASAAAGERAALDADDVVRMWRKGLEGVMERGKANIGDKTMVDALQPAVEQMRGATGGIEDLFQIAADAALSGARATADMVAQHGRAKFVGERAIGHMDAGAMSVAIMFEAMAQYLKGHIDGKT